MLLPAAAMMPLPITRFCRHKAAAALFHAMPRHAMPPRQRHDAMMLLRRYAAASAMLRCRPRRLPLPLRCLMLTMRYVC